MPPSPDPVSQPDAYRNLLLGLLGDDDPTDVQAATPDLLRAIVKASGDAMRRRPEPAEWSPLEVVAHVVQAEIVYAARYRWILAHDEPPLIGYDQDLWVDRLRANEAAPGDLLDLFDALRKANIALWKRTPDGEKLRFGMHEERGPESYDQAFRLIAGHDRFHLDQARRALEAVRR